MENVLFLLYTSEIWLFPAVKKEKIKNLKQKKNLEKDREKIWLHKDPKWCRCARCSVTSVKSFPFNWFMQVYLSAKGPSHQLQILHICISWFPASCLIRLEDGLFLQSNGGNLSKRLYTWKLLGWVHCQHFCSSCSEDIMGVGWEGTVCY